MAKRSVTIRDIAEKLNVSTTTVSKALNGASDISGRTKRLVFRQAAEMGYVPNILAANLRRSRASLVALVLSDVSKPYFARVIASCEAALESAGYTAMTFSSMESAQRESMFLHTIVSMNMAGMIIDPAQESDGIPDTLKQMGIPYVFSNRYLDAANDCYVAADNVRAGYLATEYLLKRRPGAPVLCLNGPDRISPTVTRLKGYKEALKDADIREEPGWIFSNCFGLADAYTMGRRMAEAFHPPFSVFCHTDQFAIGVMRALRDVGLRIPEDVSIVGIDDIDTARYIHPALTTVALPKEEIGRKSAEMLIALMQGREPEQRQILLEPKLVIRESA